MAIVAMANAVPGAIASSTEYNKLISNINDIDSRLGPVVSAASASFRLGALESVTSNGTSGNSALNTRVGTLETRTTDTTTNGGHGNVQLSTRLGTGVGTGSNVTTGSATSQLTDLRSRATTLETTVNAAGSGNSALNTRVGTLESATGVSPLVFVTRATDQTLTTTTENAISWSSAPKNANSMWAAGNPTRLTIPAGQGGLYVLSGTLIFTANANGGRTAHVRKNGAGLFYRMSSAMGSSTIHTEMAVDYPIELAAGDYIEVFAWQNSGSNLNLLGANTAGEFNQPVMMLRKVAS